MGQVLDDSQAGLTAGAAALCTLSHETSSDILELLR